MAARAGAHRETYAPRNLTVPKAIAYVERPPVQSVFGGVRRAGGGSAHAASAGADEFRPARWRLSAGAIAVRRSGRVRPGLRTRQALPRLELQLSERQN